MTKVKVRAGDFIRMMYENISVIISAFSFGLHLLAPKIFKRTSRKKKSETENEEDSKEKWCRESKCQKSYVDPNLPYYSKMHCRRYVIFEKRKCGKFINNKYSIRTEVH